MVRILGVEIDNLNMEEALERVDIFLQSEQQYHLTTPNPEFLIQAQQDKEFKNILNHSDLTIPDGVGLIFASYFLGQPIKKRITGVDLMEKICQRAAQKNWSVFLMGAESGVSEKTAENLRIKYHGLVIKVIKVRPRKAGTLCKGFRLQGLTLGNKPSILFVALGAPKQEKWINSNLSKLPSVKLAMGVGGAFDFISGRVSRAPKVVRLAGLEWLWRFICQPWRIKRIYNATIKFPWLVLKSRK